MGSAVRKQPVVQSFVTSVVIMYILNAQKQHSSQQKSKKDQFICINYMRDSFNPIILFNIHSIFPYLQKSRVFMRRH